MTPARFELIANRLLVVLAGALVTGFALAAAVAFGGLR